MKRFLFAALFLAALAATALGGEKKSLLIMFDGLRADALYSTPTPNIDSIIDGSWAPGYHASWTYQAHTNLDADPSSATNHVAIITGVTAEKNRCFNNGQIKDALWKEYPSYLSRLRAADPSLVTVWLYNWSENADVQTDATFFGDPRGGYAGDMQNIDRTIAFLNDTFDEPTDYHGQSWTKGTDPDAIGLYLDSLDMYGHRDCFSAFDPEYCRRMEMYDARVGDLLAAIKARPSFDREDWMVVIVADHGGYHGYHGVPLCENCYTIPLIVTSKHTAAGRMLGQPQNCDCAAYLLDHHLGA
ncbi:MAG: alkaline phosphatase family protein, partial [Thermoguttaceae bacterium]|nr:alkaline phosphatase family protein [Thermoguttaceae bacterium]